MERLCSLFFELSNEDRLSIILKLMETPMKLTQIAKELDLSAQECSRQLSRLMDIDLVTKHSDGNFGLQPYAEHVFMIFPGFQFLTEHVDYFNKHTLTMLPEKFRGRIGELRGCQSLKELMGTFTNIERILNEAEEYFWYITDEVLIPTRHYKTGLDALERGVQVRCIEPAGYFQPKGILQDTEDEQKAFVGHRSEGNLTDRTLEKVNVTMYMNEKEVAILAFPAKTGEFDYLGFTSTDEKTLEWCKDLHRYYWEKADPQIGHHIDSKR